MPNYIKITTDPETIHVEFRDLSTDPAIGISEWIMGRGYIEWAQKKPSGGVTIKTKSNQKIDVCCIADPIPKHFFVDDINGSTVFADNSALFAKIKSDILIRLY